MDIPSKSVKQMSRTTPINMPSKDDLLNKTSADGWRRGRGRGRASIGKLKMLKAIFFISREPFSRPLNLGRESPGATLVRQMITDWLAILGF